MERILIVYGPQGAGKTAMAKRLSQRFGGRLVDPWDGTDQLLPGDIAVTNISPPPVVEGAEYFEVKP